MEVEVINNYSYKNKNAYTDKHVSILRFLIYVISNNLSLVAVAFKKQTDKQRNEIKSKKKTAASVT